MARNPVNMLDPIWKCFGCGQLWPLRPACSKNRTRYNAGSDFPHPIWFCSSKEGLDHIVQNWPGSNLDGPSQVLAKRNWSRSKPVHKNHWARFWQTTTGPLPDSHFQTWLQVFFHRRHRSYCAKPAQICFGTDCVMFWPQIWSGSKLVGKNHQVHFWTMLLSWSGLDANRSGMFTGNPVTSIPSFVLLVNLVRS